MTEVVARTDGWWVSASDVDSRIRVLCLPSAGAGATAYLRWQRALPEGVQVVSARLPGREARIAERPWVEMEAIVGALARAAGPLVDRAFVLFGHSMGALIAFELAHEMRRRYQLEPTALVVSGHGAPDVLMRMHLSKLGDEELVEALGRLGGTPREVLAEAEFLALLLPAIRADLRICEGYVYRPRPLLTRPLHAFVGCDDPLVSINDAARWRVHTSGEFWLHKVAGDHFYFHDAPDELLACIGGLCWGTLIGGAL